MSDTIAPPPPLPWLEHRPDGAVLDPGLGGPLRVSPVPGSGPVIVATDALLAHADRLVLLRDSLADDAAALERATAAAATALCTAPPSIRAVTVDASHACTRIREAHARVESADRMLRRAIETYSLAEAGARAQMITLGGVVATVVGPILRALLLIGIPVALGAAAAGRPTPEQLASLREWMLAHPELITSPEFVEAVRAGVMSVDEGAAAVAGIPPGLAGLMEAAIGVTGVEAGAGVVLAGAAPFGLFRDGPVFVERVSTSATAGSPEGAVQRLARVPEGDQVRIERYEVPGGPPRYVVYVGPTETFSPVARDEPWDLTSNVTGVAGRESGSLRATEAAMRDAGVQPGDAVQFVGFSQGGLVAARLAASGDWNAAGLETYGAPSGNVALPSGLHGMAVRNSDDFVPALAGPQLDHSLLQVERRAFDPGAAIPTDLPAPAHQRNAYVATATEIDRAQSAAVREQIDALDAFTGDYARQPGSRVTVMMYHAERGELKSMTP